MAYSELHDLERKMQQNMANSFDSRPKKKIPKKHILRNSHYTKEFLLMNHQNQGHKTGVPIMPATIHDPVSASKVTVFGKQDLKKYENTYTPIKIHDMVPGVVNKERILYAKAIVEKDMMTSLHTVIEDEHGGACKLCLYNLTPAQQDAFCKDVKMAILNPYYKKARDGMCMMRVDNPMEVILIPPDTPASPFILPSEHKDRGNKLFKENKLTEAVVEYSQAIMGDRHDPFFYSNRALCYTKLNRFEAALSDATSASDIDPTDTKFQYRAAIAWSGIGNHERAIEILRNLVVQAKENTEKQSFEDRIRIENVYLAQQHGEINLQDIERIVLAGLSVQMADFVGPITLKKSSFTGCAERGLFATRDIRSGEVIHVSKAAVFIRDHKMDLFESIEISRSTSVSPPFQVLVSKLIDKMNTSKLFAHRVLNLVESDNTSPFYNNIDLFTDKGYDLVKDMESPEFSIENIRSIATTKGFSSTLHGDTNLSFSTIAQDIMGSNTYGMWFIPSLLNHSCVGNIMRIVKGEVCVLKVFRDVKAGEELAISSFDGAYQMTLQDRKKSLRSKHGYKCNCLLCKYESEPNITPLLAQVATLYTQTLDFWYNYAINSGRRLSSPVPLPKYNKIVARAIELAEALGLGHRTFCGSLWASLMDLTYILDVPIKDQMFLLEKIQDYLCELEVYHQFSYWKNYHKICMQRLGPDNIQTSQAYLGFVKYNKLFKWE